MFDCHDVRSDPTLLYEFGTTWLSYGTKYLRYEASLTLDRPTSWCLRFMFENPFYWLHKSLPNSIFSTNRYTPVTKSTSLIVTRQDLAGYGSYKMASGERLASMIWICNRPRGLWTELLLQVNKFNSSQTSPCFYVSAVEVSWKHCGKRRNFSFSHSVFYPSEKLSSVLIKFEIVVCKLFQFGRLFGKGLNK